MRVHTCRWFSALIMILISGYCIIAAITFIAGIDELHMYNPHAQKVTGPFALPKYHTPPEYIRSTCEIRIEHVTIDVTMSTTCKSPAVLDAHNETECADVPALWKDGYYRRDELTGGCYMRRPCQGDICKYDCEFSVKPTSSAAVQVVTNGVSYRANTYWASVSTRFDGKSVMCDYIVGPDDDKSMHTLSVLYIQPKGLEADVLYYRLVVMPLLITLFIMLVATPIMMRLPELVSILAPPQYNNQVAVVEEAQEHDNNEPTVRPQ